MVFWSKKPKSVDAPNDASTVEDAANSTSMAASNPIEAYGECLLVFSDDPKWNFLALLDLHNAVSSAVKLEQALIAKAGDPSAPVGVALWALVNEQVDADLRTQMEKPIILPRLEENDWRSGGIPWLIALAGPHPVRTAVRTKLQSMIGDDRPLSEFLQHFPNQ